MSASNLKQPYLLARLHKGKCNGKDRWCIKFYQTNPVTKKRQRFMPTFDMNRIKSRKVREDFAKDKIKELNKLLTHGYPFTDITIEELNRIEAEKGLKEGKRNPLHDTNIVQAVLISVKFRQAKTTKPRSKQMHQSRGKLFIDYLEEKKLNKKSIISFGPKDAKKYLNYITLEKNLVNTTFNNTLAQIKRHFKELQSNDYIIDNPFDGFKRLPPSPKLRRDLSPEERRTVTKYLHENHKRLYYAFLLQYTGLIRPGALRELKFSWIKIKEGIIQIPPAGNKTNEWKNVTIPNSVMLELIKDGFMNYPNHWFVFGDKLKPHQSKQCGVNTMNYYFKKALEHLVKVKELNDIKGLMFYSGKDTGITELSNRVGLLDLQRQAGHKDPKVTMKYYHNKRKIKAIEKLDIDMMND